MFQVGLHMKINTTNYSLSSRPNISIRKAAYCDTHTPANSSYSKPLVGQNCGILVDSVKKIELKLTPGEKRGKGPKVFGRKVFYCSYRLFQQSRPIGSKRLQHPSHRFRAKSGSFSGLFLTWRSSDCLETEFRFSEDFRRVINPLQAVDHRLLPPLLPDIVLAQGLPNHHLLSLTISLPSWDISSGFVRTWSVPDPSVSSSVKERRQEGNWSSRSTPSALLCAPVFLSSVKRSSRRSSPSPLTSLRF